MKLEIFNKDLIVTDIKSYYQIDKDVIYYLKALFSRIIIKYTNGTIIYLNKNYLLDRLDGPALIYPNGYVCYCINGIELNINIKIKKSKKFNLHG